ncbi:unnamed protein product [Notodromas monacha]|uniref:PAT complex subunit CCDC47 n=1 Tax=Notodromas monacha TaxID=399045 RepID=A0A7R9BIQ2_9CRUS|nr:unnamed protein product [Notodromas monacha]CAG0915138.1 unnamed protein product [Notodromas monacha]
MKSALFLFTSLFCLSFVASKISTGFSREDVEDNDFADFEEFEEFDDEATKEDVVLTTPAPVTRKSDIDDDETSIEDEDENGEFEHFRDEEEFEGYDADKPSRAHGKTAPEIKIARVPMFINTKWDSYVMEILILSGLAVYILNFMIGRAKNAKIAQAWFACHKQILDENFALVGDDGRKDLPSEGCGLEKESEHVYTLWCSGRSCCEGMLVELKLLKRQDLVSIIAQMFKKAYDTVEIKVQMNADELDTFVAFAGQKKTATKVAKDMNDLATYGGEKRTGDKYGLPSSYVVLSEIGEGTQTVLDSRTQAVINKYPELVEYIHVSDQFSGPKPSDEAGQPQTKLPEGKKVIRVGINFPTKGNGQVNLEEIDSMKPVLLLVIYLMDRLKRFHLSKESKSKAEKNRARVEESFLKTTHQVRAEAAAQRREERRRQEKEKIMAEEDPEKQRRWEEKESRRQMKKRQPRIKQLKVKAL